MSFSFIPITYLGIKLTHIPEMVFVLNVVRNMLGVIVRMYIMRKQLNIGITDYFQMVAVKVLTVSCIAVIMPLVVYYQIGVETFPSFFVILVVSVVSIMLAVYFIGLEDKEKKFVTQKVRMMITNRTQS